MPSPLPHAGSCTTVTEETISDTLDSFFDEWEPKLFASVRRRVPDAQTAEDLTQDVLVALYLQVSDGAAREGLPQLMFGIANHKIADWFRANIPKATLPIDPLLAGIADQPGSGRGPGQSPVEHLSQRMHDALDELERILPRLTRSQRNAVLYRHYVGMSVPEVAEAMGVTHNAAKRFLVRGMDNIRTLLRQAGYEISVSTEEMPQ
jgi:RNA polymerase sigma-70 factor (ECF subfamily)